MGFFQSLASLLGQGAQSRTAPSKPYLPWNNTQLGHVTDVVLSKQHPSYNPKEGIFVGTIFWRNVDKSSGYGTSAFSFEEMTAGKLADPLDRSNYKIPYPGEQVVIWRAKKSRLDDPTEVKGGYYYSTVVSMEANITSNVAPFIGVDPRQLAFNNAFGGQRTISELSKRFDKLINNLNAIKQPSSQKPIIHRQLQVNEGDFILQGRFGGSIRFAGTPDSGASAKYNFQSQPWAEGPAGGQGTPGDPIMLMRVDNERAKETNLEDTTYEAEDIEVDGASIYMTSTQQIYFQLAVPEKGTKAHPLASWANDFGITVSVDGNEAANSAEDGEAARSGADKTSGVEAGNTEEYESNDGAPSPENPLPDESGLNASNDANNSNGGGNQGGGQAFGAGGDDGSGVTQP